MDNDRNREKQVPAGILTGISFTVLTEIDAEKLSVVSVEHPNEVTDAKLGFPNPTSQCTTCGAKNAKHCEGHFGVIKFGRTILHPYFMSEVVQILNRICPGCKTIRKDLRVKGPSSLAKLGMLKSCKHCCGGYPSMRFRVSSNDEFRKTAIIVEVTEKLPKKFQGRSLPLFLPDDYWDFIPKDVEQEASLNRPNRRVLTHTQLLWGYLGLIGGESGKIDISCSLIHYLLKDVSPKFVKEFVSKTDALFLNCFPVTPNCHRVTEFVRPLANGQKLVFDDRTRIFRKLAGYKGRANELASHVFDSLNLSKLHLDKPSNESSFITNKDALTTTCSKWLREVVLAKRSNHIFRTVVTGDPNLKLSEVGIPCYIAERLQVADNLSSWNWEKLIATCNLSLLEKGEVFARRKGDLVRIRDIDQFQIGDTINRPLSDGDVVLINRPPTIHQHSLLALSVKVLPVSFVVSINPLCCAPLHGDFDGDCLHGYIPQSVDSRVELKELVALDKQLTNGQSGKNLLSLGHDSLTAVYLLMAEGDLLDQIQLQNLAMWCPQSPKPPVIVKACRGKSLWTGTQLFSMLLPPDFDYASLSNDVLVRNGELISCPAGSFWLHGDVNGNFFEALIRHCSGEFLDYLHAAQQVLCEWLTSRGLSVSLSDLYLSSDSRLHDNMIEEVHCGLQEAERMCHFRQLMVESSMNYLSDITESHIAMVLEAEQLCFEKQRSAALSRASVKAFKYIFRDIQNLTYQHSSSDNSLLAIIKSGSKGSLLKIVQQAMCLGLQHSLVPLSFRLPYELSCPAWNNLKTSSSGSAVQDSYECSESYIPYAVVESSFLAGLNPLECFVHSVTCRDSSFSENAEVPGTLNKRLMFFMRDLYTAYDGTVRNAYGNQLIQFSYGGTGDSFSPVNSGCDSFDESSNSEPVAGQPVGSLATCAISEVAYSALDQPVSVLEASPLLNLKKVLESGSKKSNTSKVVSLYLSKKLGRVRHGFEYAILEVKNHLEKLLFSDIVSTVMIIYSPQSFCDKLLSPWVCHFHVCKGILRRRRLKLHSIIAALSSFGLYKLQINCQNCSLADMEQKTQGTLCITVTIIESSRNSTELDTIQDVLIPNLLSCVVKGYLEVERVDIVWNDQLIELGSPNQSFGELCLRVYGSPKIKKTKLWSKVMDDCLPIMGLIDWTRSHPDDLYDMFSVYGIGAAWRYFVGNLKSAVHDIGKTVLPGHMILVADCLSATGEFIGLTAKGMTRQKAQMSVSAPFMQACFSSPAKAFTKAAKFGASDQLQGSLEALAWGKIPSLGTGAKFEFIYTGKRGQELGSRIDDVYSQLHTLTSYHECNVKMKVPNGFKLLSEDIDAQHPHLLAEKGFNSFKNLGTLTKSLLQSRITVNDVLKLSQTLKYILNKYSMDERLSDLDKTTILMALHFHPRSEEKFGTGAVDIKVGCHPKHQDTRCFILERKDGTIEDFSYRKCVLGALEIIDPCRAKNYQSKWLKFSTANV